MYKQNYLQFAYYKKYNIFLKYNKKIFKYLINFS